MRSYVLVLFAMLLAEAGFCAEALKQRQTVEKPKRTAVDRAHHSIIIKGGSTSWTGTINNPLSVYACLGSTTIGQ